MYKEFGISEKVIDLARQVEEDIKPVFEEINKT